MKAGKGYFEFCQEYTLVIEKHSSNKTREDSTHGHYQIVSTEIRQTIFLVAKARPGADCGLDHELLIAKFRLKLKKVGKTTRPFSYDLNQISYYPMEVTNRFKGLYVVHRVPEELWMEVHDIV